MQTRGLVSPRALLRGSLIHTSDHQTCLMARPSPSSRPYGVLCQIMPGNAIMSFSTVLVPSCPKP
eukprot:1141139-Lingulodinium_polyedra.AAC.1